MTALAVAALVIVAAVVVVALILTALATDDHLADTSTEHDTQPWRVAPPTACAHGNKPLACRACKAELADLDSDWPWSAA